MSFEDKLALLLGREVMARIRAEHDRDDVLAKNAELGAHLKAVIQSDELRAELGRRAAAPEDSALRRLARSAISAFRA